MIPPYAELRCSSNFTFLTGASWPEELVQRAKSLGYAAVAITDECTRAGMVIVWPSIREEQPKELLRSRLLAVKGRWQRQGDACSLIAKRLKDLTSMLGELETSSRDFQ